MENLAFSVPIGFVKHVCIITAICVLLDSPFLECLGTISAFDLLHLPFTAVSIANRFHKPVTKTLPPKRKTRRFRSHQSAFNNVKDARHLSCVGQKPHYCTAETDIEIERAIRQWQFFGDRGKLALVALDQSVENGLVGATDQRH